MKNTLIASALMSFLLTACGGGGGGSDSGEAPTPDTTAPVIILVGSSTVTVEAGSAYTDEGATAVDSFEGSLTPMANSTIKTNTVGSTYTVTYNATDSSGNTASQITRTVHAEDTVDSSLISSQVPSL